MQGSARDALRHRSSQWQRRGLIRPQGDLWAALRAARSGCESFGAEGQVVTQGEGRKKSPDILRSQSGFDATH